MPLNTASRANLIKGRFKAAEKVDCGFCDKQFARSGIDRHRNSCHFNPINLRHCPICNNVITKSGGITCSHGCANKHFRSGINHPNWSNDSYRSTCFFHHGKKCIICGEENVVDAHHHDKNRNNNDPMNLVPLCPTHHQYVHSQCFCLIADKYNTYIKDRLAVV